MYLVSIKFKAEMNEIILALACFQNIKRLGLDLLIGVKVCVFFKPDTKGLMSVLYVRDVFPNAKK